MRFPVSAASTSNAHEFNWTVYCFAISTGGRYETTLI
jgi:hypothetical protein